MGTTARVPETALLFDEDQENILRNIALQLELQQGCRLRPLKRSADLIAVLKRSENSQDRRLHDLFDRFVAGLSGKVSAHLLRVGAISRAAVGNVMEKTARAPRRVSIYRGQQVLKDSREKMPHMIEGRVYRGRPVL